MPGKSRSFGSGLAWGVGLIAAIALLYRFDRVDRRQPELWNHSAIANQPASYSAIANAAFQQDVDHFSDDARAMSPRSWSGFDEPSGREPQLPQVTFDERSSPVRNAPQNPSDEIQLDPDANRFRQVENSTLRQPRRFYETKPLETDRPEPPEGSLASPLPDLNGEQEQDVPTPSRVEPDANRPPPKNTVQQRDSSEKLESRLEQYEGPAYSQGISSELKDYGSNHDSPRDIHSYSFDTSDDLSSLYSGNVLAEGCCDACGLPMGRERRQRLKMSRDKQAGASKPGGNKSRPRIFGKSKNNDDFESDDWLSTDCDGSCESDSETCCCQEPKFNSALGHRSPNPVTSQFVGSSGETFPFEEDTHFPSMGEILAQAVGFGEVEFMFLQPSFQGNSAITVAGPGSGQSFPFNFDLEPAFRVNAGFESEYGPGFAGEYFQFDNNSDSATFTSDGSLTGQTRLYQIGPNAWSSLVASNAGESINALHSLEVHSSSVYAFKALNFKRAYVNGRFGIQVASIDQKLEADLRDAGGNLLGRLRGVSNLNAFGPKFGIDYVRRIGHTPMQLVSSSTASVLFGDRDQIVENTWSNEFNSIGADEFVTMIDIFLGVQAKRHSGEHRNTAFRMGWVNQTWIGGGTAIDPNDDFGFQGISMMLGFNR